jgi:hypothetical protein
MNATMFIEVTNSSRSSQGPELRPFLSQRVCEMSNLETYREKALKCAHAADEVRDRGGSSHHTVASDSWPFITGSRALVGGQVKGERKERGASLISFPRLISHVREQFLAFPHRLASWLSTQWCGRRAACCCCGRKPAMSETPSQLCREPDAWFER